MSLLWGPVIWDPEADRRGLASCSQLEVVEADHGVPFRDRSPHEQFRQTWILLEIILKRSLLVAAAKLHYQ